MQKNTGRYQYFYGCGIGIFTDIPIGIFTEFKKTSKN